MKYCALALLLLAPFAQAGEIKSDENIQFFPETAALQSDGNVRVRIRSWIYELEQRPGAQWLLSKYLKLDESKLSDEERQRYQARTQLFRVDSERGKTVQVQLFGKTYALPSSDGDGRSNFIASVASNEFSIDNARQAQWFNYSALLPADDQRQYIGRSLLVPAQGISIVSDIDDTIKDSKVLNKHELLMNTFVRQYKTVDGMAVHYSQFAQNSSGVAFHYVSGSPIQLYPALAEFMDANKFPAGSMHLRDVKVSKEIFSHAGTRTHKLGTIRQLLRDFPQRQFVLIGDSGELDPEIYATLAREFPQQIQAIWIRDITQQTRSDPRYIKVFKDIPAERWHLFTQASQLQLG